ncbi:MAG: precorrin-6A reductase [Huintestinicola sp.]
MFDVLIFGGTTEGRLLAEYCAETGRDVYVSAATEYGSSLLPDSPHIRSLTGRMDRDGISRFIRNNSISAVIDATHPYAVEASENIRNACSDNKIRSMRIIRCGGESNGAGIYFESAAEAAEHLDRTKGSIFITTGSKELSVFCRISDFADRCAVRILPTEKYISSCLEMGFRRDRIIAAQGPFSVEENVRHFSRYDSEYVVTKDSGAAGGFPEKYEAARSIGAKLLIIRRPMESGITLEEAKKMIGECSV